MEHMDNAIDKANMWSASLIDAVGILWIRILDFVPNLLAFLVILLIGYVVSHLLASAAQRAMGVMKIDAFSERIGIGHVLRRANVQQEMSKILSRIIFWLLMLTFLVSATESLGLPRVSSTIDSFVLYIPKVLGAAFILMIGLFIAQFFRDLVTSGAESIGSEFAGPLGSAAYGLLVIIVASLAIGQLEIETDLLNMVVSIGLISLGAAAALGFGLGSREVASNILSGSYVRDLLREGDEVSIGSIRGTVSQITAVKTEIVTENGDVLSVSNRDVIENNVIRHK
ncbi:MAG: small-conductance mechanosensitive channel [Candidatus Azotimanducaceae bacterium]|jgi:small-conductance mechanosensitive channel